MESVEVLATGRSGKFLAIETRDGSRSASTRRSRDLISLRPSTNFDDNVNQACSRLVAFRRAQFSLAYQIYCGAGYKRRMVRELDFQIGKWLTLLTRARQSCGGCAQTVRGNS